MCSLVAHAAESRAPGKERELAAVQGEICAVLCTYEAVQPGSGSAGGEGA